MVQDPRLKQVFKPYAQKGGTCGGFSIAGGLRQIHQKDIPESEVYRIYKAHDTDGRDGIRTVDLLNILKKEPIGGLKVKEWDTLYNTNNAKRRNKATLTKDIIDVLKTPGKALIYGFKLCKGPRPIPLDRYVYRGNSDVSGDFHICHVQGLWKNLGIELTNSWGEHFGEKGSFHMRWVDVIERADSVFVIQ